MVDAWNIRDARKHTRGDHDGIERFFPELQIGHRR